MLNKVLNENIYKILEDKVHFENINEIRIRANLPITILSNGQTYYLSTNGLTFNKEMAIKLNGQDIEDIIYKASEFSIYSVNEELKQGFIVLSGGERIGISGSVIMENGKVQTITNFTSLNMRIPHIVKGCCLPVFEKLINDYEIYNTLIISSPGQGKTTFLRDFAYQLSKHNYFFNILLLDERGEIAGKNNILELGESCDVLSFCTKKIGFMQGIRAMNPDIIMTDELGESEDFESIKYASNAGVKVVATIHAGSVEQLKSKPNFSLISNVFERFIVLNSVGKPGEIKGVYGKNFSKL